MPTNVSQSYVAGPKSDSKEEATNRSSDTAKQNFTAQKIGNDKGAISFGKLPQDAISTKGVALTTPDGEHEMWMDIDGPRKGWTSFTGPGNFNIIHGSANPENGETIAIIAEQGNLLIKANNGIIRMEADDIQLNARHSSTDKGSIRMNATQNISSVCREFTVNAEKKYRIFTTGLGEIVANSQLKTYSAVLKMVDDSCGIKDSKNNLKRVILQNNVVN
jgi:hypothetical protein